MFASWRRRRKNSGDPIGDDAHTPVEGVVHRYPDRALLKPVHVCPAYCRFCFRREMVGPGKRPTLSKRALDAALDYIAARSEIWEVILTGGDPFLLSPRRARAITQRLSEIEHVKVIPGIHAYRLSIRRASPLRSSRRSAQKKQPTWRCTPIIRANSPPRRAQPVRA